MALNPRFLVIDGYTKSARDELEAGGATSAGVQYQNMLIHHAPGASVDIIYPCDVGDDLPSGTDLASYDGIAWTGCSLCVFEDKPEVRAQIELARAAFRVQVPGFGSCWAAQIAVVAAGGLVQANPNGREMGFARKIQLTPEGLGHPMYAGKPGVFDAYISHVDEITHLPAGAISLSGNAFTAIQSVSVIHEGGVFWGLQYHPEYDLREMARLTWCRIEKLMELGFFNSREAGEEHVRLLESLHQDPSRTDVVWLLGVDDDILNRDVRQLEVKNWIDQLVIPTMMKRR